MNNNKKRRITAADLAGGGGASAAAACAPGGAGATRAPWPPWCSRDAGLPALLLCQAAGLLPPRALRGRQLPHLVRRGRLQAAYRAGASNGGAAGSNTAGAGAGAAEGRARGAACVRVAELLGAGPYLLVVLHSGECAAFDVASGRRLCGVNAGPGDVVRSMFLNRRRGEVLTVGCRAADGFRSLRCRAVPLRFPPPAAASADGAGGEGGAGGATGAGGANATRGAGGAGGAREVFASERVAYPGFFEFDDTNGKALIYNAATGSYKVYCLASYRLLHALPAVGLRDVRMSGGLLAAVRGGAAGELKLEVVSAENGQLLARHRLALGPLTAPDDLEVLELFGSSLLVKQPGGPLHVYDAATLAPRGEAPAEQLPGGCSLVHLPEHARFLAVCGQGVSIWDMAARKVADLEGPPLWYPGASDLVYSSAQLRLVVSYCRRPAAPPGGGAAGSPPGARGGGQPQQQQQQQQQQAAELELPEAGAAGCIRVSDTVTGRLIALIGAAPPTGAAAAGARGSSGGGARASGGGARAAVAAAAAAAAAAWGGGGGGAAVAAAEALTDVSALYLDEDSLAVYTGNHQGAAHRWGPEGPAAEDEGGGAEL